MNVTTDATDTEFRRHYYIIYVYISTVCIAVRSSYNAKMLKCGIVFVFVFGVIVEASILCDKDAVIKRINDTSSVCIPSDSVSQVNVFPKCCPLTYAYDKNARFCIASKQQNRFSNHSLFRIGLKNCINKRVTDYYNTDAKILEKEYGIRNYCVDEVYDSKEKEIVLRKCEEGNVEEDCRVDGARCLRKCCPDHEIYVRAQCGPTTNVTFNYANWIDSVHVLKGRT